MGVAGEPAAGRQVRRTPDPQRQLPLALLDAHGLPKRLVLESAGHVDDHLTARKPALAGAVDVGVGALPEHDVAAHVQMPAADVLVDVVVVTVRLVRNTFRGTEVHPARHRASGRVVQHLDVHPVAAGVDELDPNPIVRGLPVAFDVAPAHPAELLALAADHEGRRRESCDRGVRGTGGRPPLARAVAGTVVLGRNRLRIAGHATVDLEVQHGVTFRDLVVGDHQPDRPSRRTDERMLVEVPEGDAADDERQTAGNDLQAFDHGVRLGVLPLPQVERLRPALVVLGHPEAGHPPATLEAGRIAVLGVADRQERVAPPRVADDLDLEAFPDRHLDGAPTGQVEDVVGDVGADAVSGGTARLQQPVRDDHVPRRLADVDRHRFGGRHEAAVLRGSFGTDEERQTAQGHLAERGFLVSAEDFDACVAHGLEREWFVAGHCPIVPPCPWRGKRFHPGPSPVHPAAVQVRSRLALLALSLPAALLSGTANAAGPAPSGTAKADDFVRVCGTRLCLHDRPFEVRGATTYGHYDDPGTEVRPARRDHPDHRGLEAEPELRREPRQQRHRPDVHLRHRSPVPADVRGST